MWYVQIWQSGKKISNFKHFGLKRFDQGNFSHVTSRADCSWKVDTALIFWDSHEPKVASPGELQVSSHGHLGMSQSYSQNLSYLWGWYHSAPK